MSLAYDPGSLVLHFAEDGRWAEISAVQSEVSCTTLLSSAFSLGATFLLY